MGSVLPELRDIPQCVRPNTSCYMFTFSLLFCTLLLNCLLVHIRGTKSQPDEQLMLDPTSAILGGKLRFDAYNNGGEWLNSVHDVGNSLVRYGNMEKSHWKPHQVGFVHAEDHYWNGRRFKAEGGKAFKSVSLGELEMDDPLRSELKIYKFLMAIKQILIDSCQKK